MLFKILIMWDNSSSYRRDDQLFDIWTEQTQNKGFEKR